MPVEALLADGKQRLHGHGLRRTAQGTMVEVGPRKGFERRGAGDYVQGGWTNEGELVEVRYGLVALSGPDRALGRLRCRVDEDRQAQIEGLREGDAVVVQGMFEDYKDAPNGMVVDMSNCTVVR